MDSSSAERKCVVFKKSAMRPLKRDVQWYFFDTFGQTDAGRSVCAVKRSVNFVPLSVRIFSILNGAFVTSRR
jgi:hypothetical protein